MGGNRRVMGGKWKQWEVMQDNGKQEKGNGREWKAMEGNGAMGRQRKGNRRVMGGQ